MCGTTDPHHSKGKQKMLAINPDNKNRPADNGAVFLFV
jgi:hypothetical protein